MSRSLLPAILLATACNLEASRYAEVLPDERLQLDFPDAAGAKSTGDWSTWYLFTHQVTDDVNGMTGLVLNLVDGIVHRFRPTWVDRDEHLAQWGPWSDALDPVETLLWVQYHPDTDVHDWGFDQWPKGEEDSRVPVIEGTVDAGASREQSTGRFTVDFTTIHALDPTSDVAVGVFGVEYSISDESTTVEASLMDFDSGEADAAYAYVEDEEGGIMDLVMHGDMNPESGTAALEQLGVRSRWTATGAGRADVAVSGGDFGAGGATLSECWDSTFQRVWYLDSFGGAEGDETACAFAEADYTTLSLP